MFDALKNLFTKPEPPSQGLEPKLAVAALLVHLAAIDGSVTPEERKAIEAVLMDSYALDRDQVDKLITEATRRDQDSVDLYRFTSTLAALENAEKLEIIKMMWQVVFADKQNHELEDNMVWRVAELIHVSTRDRTVLRNQIARSET